MTRSPYQVPMPPRRGRYPPAAGGRSRNERGRKPRLTRFRSWPLASRSLAFCPSSRRLSPPSPLMACSLILSRSETRLLAAAVPASARELLLQQIDTLTSAPQQSLGFGLLISLAAALWSASGGVGNLISAINLAYDEEETRGFVRRKALALALTLGAIVFSLIAVGLIAVAPVVLDANGVPTLVRLGLEAARWVLLLAAVVVALAVVYRVAPDRDAPKLTWVSVGAIVATVVWLVASLAFSLYVDNFGSYGKTYGSLAAVVVLLLWLWITVYVILLGAEINAEAEEQTVRDTTTGPEKPLGERDANKADSVPRADDPTKPSDGKSAP